MPINISGLVPASIKSKNVATEDYVDTSVASNVVSNNLIKNSEFKIEPKSNSAQWIQSDCWIKHPNNGIDTISTYTIVDRIDGQGSSPYLTHSLIKGSTIVVVQNGSTADYETSIVFDDDGGNLIYYGYQTLATEWFQFSAYLGFINCSGYLKVAFSNRQGIKISEVNSLIVDGTKQGGGYLDEFHDVHINAQTPADAFFITVMFVKNGTISSSDSVGIVSKPQLVRTKGSSNYRIPYAPNGDASSNSSLAFSDLRNVTKIDGGKIITGSIDTQHLSATAISGKLITGSEISGGTISGVNILGSIIKASFIDMSSSLLLSNWKYYTLSTIPSAYEANFAHQNVAVNGSTISQLLVDTEGYVRLPAQSGFLTTAVSGTRYGNFYTWGAGPANVPVSFTANKIFDLYPYDSYTVNTLNRVPYTSANISHISGECSFYSRCGVQANEGCTNSASWSCRVLNDVVTFGYFIRLGGGGYTALEISVNGKKVYIADTYNGTVAFGTRILTRTSRGIKYHVDVDYCSFVPAGSAPYSGEGPGPLTGFDTKLTVDIAANETIEGFTNGDLIVFYGGSGTFKSDATATVMAIHDVRVNYPVIRAM